jgi:3'-phosphoadenosine 5'-phosphosulfate sulfotransferase (PAPS reductase)/FAD synthetase
MRKTVNVVSISGGKDSAATILLALSRCAAGSVVPIFCDTGNEHAEVYNYLAYLEQALDISIVRLKADFSEQIAAKRRFIANDQRHGRDKHGRRLRWSNKAKRRALAVLYPTGNPFIDLCLWKGRFPSRKAQFCTEELKRNMAVSYQLDLIDQGLNVVSWQGVRRDESQNRRNAKKIERIGPHLYAFRPLVEWSATQVFEYCASNGLQPNPLYKQGMSRVGCMPCINAGKEELRQIAARFPDSLEEKSRWEMLVGQASKRGFSTFFNKELHGGYNSDRRIMAANRIEAVIHWAHTSRGGRQLDMLAIITEPAACSSAYGLCE